MIIKLEMCTEDVRLAAEALEEAAIRGYGRARAEGTATGSYREGSHAAAMDYVATKLRRVLEAQGRA